MREFRCVAKAAEPRIEVLPESGARGDERTVVEGGGGAGSIRLRRRDCIDFFEYIDESGASSSDLGPMAGVVVRDPREHVPECRQAVARLLREVRAAEERSAVPGREEHRERPAARAARDQVLGDLIDSVDIGPLLPIDLDVDEALVEQARRLLVLEAFLLENRAPVAGGVADGEVNRLVFGPGLLERSGSPGM